MKNRRLTAYKIFDDYMTVDGRLPTRDEFEIAYYGQIQPKGIGHYYYTVRKKWIEETQKNFMEGIK